MLVLFWISLALLAYVYVFYPVLIWMFGRIFNKPHLADESCQPPVTLVIPVYNEEKVIEKKILNSLALDYPKNKLEIMVSSDNSNDLTGVIARQYLDRGIRFSDFTARTGKMGVLNRSVPLAAGEIIVFTDANSMFEQGAIKNLVRHFADPGVGCVSGAKVIVKSGGNTSAGEGIYWKWESFLKRQESLSGSCVSADGAIYAIRRALYPFPPDNVLIMDDFAVSLKIIAQGYRCIYDPQARAYEESSVSMKDEFKRKRRILAGALTVIINMRHLLGFKSPILIQLWSHKVLRWMSGVFMLLAFVAAMLLRDQPFYGAMFYLQSAFYLAALCGWGLNIVNKDIRLFYLPFYFCLINFSQLFGVLTYIEKHKIAAWDKVGR